MAEESRMLKEDESQRFLYRGADDGIVYCKLKEYFSKMPGCHEFVDDSGGKWADKRYISRTYHLKGGTAEIVLLSNEHLLVLSNPPNLDLGDIKQAIPELREYVPGKGCETEEDALKRQVKVTKKLEDNLGE